MWRMWDIVFFIDLTRTYFQLSNQHLLWKKRRGRGVKEKGKSNKNGFLTPGFFLWKRKKLLGNSYLEKFMMKVSFFLSDPPIRVRRIKKWEGWEGWRGEGKVKTRRGEKTEENKHEWPLEMPCSESFAKERLGT